MIIRKYASRFYGTSFYNTPILPGQMFETKTALVDAWAKRFSGLASEADQAATRFAKVYARFKGVRLAGRRLTPAVVPDGHWPGTSIEEAPKAQRNKIPGPYRPDPYLVYEAINIAAETDAYKSSPRKPPTSVGG